TRRSSDLFRYQDMAALAAWYLKRHPGISRYLQERFPIVFFDETQDTLSAQARLLHNVLAPGSVVQRFGDDRQAIYHSLEDESDPTEWEFPGTKTLSMKRSFRLSPSIA